MWRGQWLPDRPEMADCGILQNRIRVIKDKWPVKTVAICQQPGGDHQPRHTLLRFHQTKRLGDVATHGQLKLCGRQATNYGIGGLVTATARRYACPLRYSCNRGSICLATCGRPAA